MILITLSTSKSFVFVAKCSKEGVKVLICAYYSELVSLGVEFYNLLIRASGIRFDESFPVVSWSPIGCFEYNVNDFLFYLPVVHA